jgi:glycosyltransferase involved in cell wall biosynthesis
MNRKSLIVFNLATDLDDYLLAHSHDWIEEFGKHFENVNVYSTRVGHTDLPRNIELKEIGGGSIAKRIQGLVRIIFILFNMTSKKREIVVFHHMNTRTVGILAWPLKFMGIPQGVWYSHPHKDQALRLGVRAVDVAFSPNERSFPFPHLVNKFIETGHGIRFENISIEEVIGRKANVLKDFKDEKKIVICVVGRISPIKRIDKLFDALEELSSEQRRCLKIKLIGPSENLQILQEIRDYTKKLDLETDFTGPLVGEILMEEILQSTFIFNGTESSVDKSALVAASVGTPVLSDNTGVLKLTGMNSFYDNLESKISLSSMLKNVLSLSETELKEIIRKSYEKTRELNDVQDLILKISDELKLVKRDS